MIIVYVVIGIFLVIEFFMEIGERGWKTVGAITSAILFAAMLVAYQNNWIPR